MMTMQLGVVVLAEAGLSFLGMGIRPPDAAWGAIVSEGYRYLLPNPVLSLSPGVAIMLLVFDRTFFPCPIGTKTLLNKKVDCCVTKACYVT
jgi:ABC-type dipeptide/oligopeptide/nickel transport system permease subunit